MARIIWNTLILVILCFTSNDIQRKWISK